MRGGDMAAGKRTVLKTLVFFYVFLRRRVRSWLSPHRKNSHAKFQRSSSSQASPEKPVARRRAVVCSVEGGLLRTSTTFPYFMLVALEAGSLAIVRALLMLLLYPLLCCVSEEAGLCVMTFVCFCGIKEEGFRAGRSVLPKHLLEDVGLEGFELLMGGGGKVCVTGMPRVMVESFAVEYLGVDLVVGRELKVAGGYYTGFMGESKEEGKVFKELFGEESSGDGVVLGLGGRKKSQQHPFFSHCEEVRVASEADKESWHTLPRDKYPKPLVFHDGRLAYRPTPSATLAMFVWLPFGFLLAIFRAVAFFTFPYKVFIPVLAFTGMKHRLVTSPYTKSEETGRSSTSAGGGSLYVCNHRTLLDPLYVSGALRKAVTAVVYSVSPVSEWLSPIKTVRMTRDRAEDGRRMAAELSKGDVVVCPEGTTCREPYLLRFSPLFAEVPGAEVVPVAVDARVGMFYGTTAGGRKWMDPLFFTMNPFPSYTVEFLQKIPVVQADGTRRNSVEVANQVQGELAKALGFERTMLTRKDKYLMLAGNEGLVNRKN